MQLRFSVIIVTKNRLDLLHECLYGLSIQAFSPSDELLLIHNGDNFLRFKKDIQEYIRKINFKIHIQYHSIQGPISKCRNHGLQKAKNHWCVFIDDDCIPIVSWLEQIKKAILQYPRSAIFIGRAISKETSNTYSLASRFHYDYWVKANVYRDTIRNLILLDTKNCVINNIFLKKHSLLFDEDLLIGEDSDLGIQIQQAEGAGKYISDMCVFHSDPTTFKSYLIKQSAYTFAAFTLLDKWQILYPASEKQEPIIKATIQYVLGIQSVFLRINVFVVLITTHVLNKLSFYFHYHNLFSKLFHYLQTRSYAGYFNRSI